MKPLSKPLLLKLYLLTGMLESAVVFYLVLSIPADVKNIIFLGLSLPRLMLLGGIFLLLLLFGLFFVQINRSDDLSKKITFFVDDGLNVRSRRFFLYLFPLFFVVLGIVLFLTPVERITGIGAYVERLAPIIYLGGAIGMQTLAGQFLWHEKNMNWRVLLEWKKLFAVTGLVFVVLLVFSAWVYWTGLGLLPEKNGWLSPGVPLVFSQLLLAWLVCLPFIVWGNKIEKWVESLQQKLPFSVRLDMIICLALWLVAFLLWWGEPMRKESYFTPSPEPPNFEYYPFSDAALYDQSAQNILIGADQNNKTILRPLYVFFLVFLHGVGGQQYENVIFLQICFLAIIPVLTYLLASMFGGRPLGLLAAILMIFRERNAIALTNVIEVSHSKLLMSDVPVMALMLLMVYVLIKWLRRSSEDHYSGILAGASFGMVMLVRSSQAQLIIPVLFLGMVFAGGFQFKRAFRRILVFVFGFAIVAAPWIWRNYQVNGKPAIETTEFYISWYAGAYTEPTDSVDILPGETAEDYSRRIKHQIVQYILDHPAKLARDYVSYFIRNEIDSVLYLPMSLKLDDLDTYLPRMQFWSDPVVRFSTGSALIFFITLGLIALGLSIAVQRMGFLGLLPLLIHFAYNFGMSLARISGWRFVLPVDWIMQFYYSIGLVALTIVVISFLSNKVSMAGNAFIQTEENEQSPRDGARKQQLLLVFFILLGMSLPLTEALIPARYPEMNLDKIVSQYVEGEFLANNGERITELDVKEFVDTEPSAVLLYGRSLYPYFYKQGEFWSDNNAFSLRVRDFDRLQFSYIGSENALVFIQLDESPQYFPNASDVFIIGCREDAGVRALAIKVNDQTPFTTTSPWQGLTCSAQ